MAQTTLWSYIDDVGGDEYCQKCNFLITFLKRCYKICWVPPLVIMEGLIYIPTLLCCTQIYRADLKLSTITCKQCLKELLQDLITRHFHCIINLHRVLCGVILFLCLFGTIVDIAVSFAKSNSSALKVSNGFMSVKGVSTAPDQTIPDTERISLLLSSAEVNLKECAILSRHQQEPVLPSEYVIELTIFHWFGSTE